jgi:hypothetical protein
LSLKRIGIAVVLAAAIYGIALGIGSLLYATGTIATGATHNDCPDYAEVIADPQHEARNDGFLPPEAMALRDVNEEDVRDHYQYLVRAATIACLTDHELTEEQAFREEYLFWTIWPGVIVGVVFLFWPIWAGILHRQEQADLAADASRLEQGT